VQLLIHILTLHLQAHDALIDIPGIGDGLLVILEDVTAPMTVVDTVKTSSLLIDVTYMTSLNV